MLSEASYCQCLLFGEGGAAEEYPEVRHPTAVSLPLGSYLKETRGQLAEGTNTFNACVFMTVKGSNILEGSHIDKYLVFRPCLYVCPLTSTGPYPANTHLESNDYPKPWEEGQFWMPIRVLSTQSMMQQFHLGQFIFQEVLKPGKVDIPECESLHCYHRKNMLI